MKDKVVTRFAPSPTGFLHIGGARTALFSYLFAKQNNGKYLLRIEDTDKERNKKVYEDAILESFEWLGITSDEDIVRQSDRLDEHKKALRELIEKNVAYEAEESDSGTGKVIRFRNPNKEVTFTDIVRGDVTFNTAELGDFVVARNIEEPLYHLAVVVDDGDMGITHVVRGEEHVSNTPRQILILEALGYSRPVYAHLPLLLATDRSKLSKRNGVVSVHKYEEDGYLPEAIVNYLALLGWHPKDDREFFSMDELIKEFDLSRVQKGGAIFDLEKLRSINKKYLQKMPNDDFLMLSKKHLPEAIFERLTAKKGLIEGLIPVLRERIEIFSDIKDMADKGEFDYYVKAPKYKKGGLSWKDDDSSDTKEHLRRVAEILENEMTGDETEDSVKNMLWEYASDSGRGSVLWPMRYALSGEEKSPNPFILSVILGKEETLERINHAIELLS